MIKLKLCTQQLSTRWGKNLCPHSEFGMCESSRQPMDCYLAKGVYRLLPTKNVDENLILQKVFLHEKVDETLSPTVQEPLLPFLTHILSELQSITEGQVCNCIQQRQECPTLMAVCALQQEIEKELKAIK